MNTLTSPRLHTLKTARGHQCSTFFLAPGVSRYECFDGFSVAITDYRDAAERAENGAGTGR